MSNPVKPIEPLKSDLYHGMRLTVGAKLVGLIALPLITSIVILVWLSTRMFIEDNTSMIQQINLDTATHLSSETREVFENVTEKMRVLGTALLEDYRTPQGRNRVIQSFFRKNKDFLGTFVMVRPKAGQFKVLKTAVSEEMKPLHDETGLQLINSIQSDKDISLEQVFLGEAAISSIKLSDGSPALALAIPFIQTGKSFTHILTAAIRQSKFVKTFSENDIITSFLVDHRGKLLAHPDAQRVASGENVGYLEVVKLLMEGKANNGQTRYVDAQAKETKLGAYSMVGFGGLGVVSDVPEAKAFEVARRVQYRSALLALVVLSLSFMLGYLFSGTITWPIKLLMQATRRIAQGDFDIHLQPKGRDEVAELSMTVNEMVKGLLERDRVKETFNKFHNKEIAEKLLSGEVKLGGERKDATIFFSDVRGFTAMSEEMEPEQVVELLNEYMTRMVAIIRSHGGIVDKYVGDAIMALWGVPLQGPNDTLNALKACLAMREELAKLNALRISRGQNALKIGMGLNCGQVIAGNIGSDEKMEYTVIGDTVNTASRMESMTKEYGTDLLIPHAIYERVKEKFVFEKCKSAKVKGKTDAIEVYRVNGYINEQGQPVLIETPYSSYASEKSDKAA